MSLKKMFDKVVYGEPIKAIEYEFEIEDILKRFHIKGEIKTSFLSNNGKILYVKVIK